MKRIFIHRKLLCDIFEIEKIFNNTYYVKSNVMDLCIAKNIYFLKYCSIHSKNHFYIEVINKTAINMITNYFRKHKLKKLLKYANNTNT